MIVRLHYEDGKTEDHALKNGEHFADYIRRVDVPGSKFAFAAQGRQQIRYLTVEPKRGEKIDRDRVGQGAGQHGPGGHGGDGGDAGVGSPSPAGSGCPDRARRCML